MIKVNQKLSQVILWSFATVSLVVLLGFSYKEQKVQLCKGLKIKIADNTGNFFIEPKDIVELLNSKAGKVKMTEMKDIDLGLLEKVVYTNPFVSKAEVYITIDGYVKISVWQRNPVIRVVTFDNEHFYIDDTGAFMPVTSDFTSSVPVATGYIFDKPIQRNIANALQLSSDTTEKPVLVQLTEVAHFIRHNEFWDAQIEQLYVNEKAEIELIPRVGKHAILIGNSDDLEAKLNNLMIFYKEGISKTGWDTYSQINLKFKDQVVCTKSGYKEKI